MKQQNSGGNMEWLSRTFRLHCASRPGLETRDCLSQVWREVCGQYIRDTARHIYMTVILLFQLLLLFVISLSAVPATFTNVFYEISLQNQIRWPIMSFWLSRQVYERTKERTNKQTNKWDKVDKRPCHGSGFSSPASNRGVLVSFHSSPCKVSAIQCTSGKGSCPSSSVFACKCHSSFH